MRQTDGGGWICQSVTGGPKSAAKGQKQKTRDLCIVSARFINTAKSLTLSTCLTSEILFWKNFFAGCRIGMSGDTRNPPALVPRAMTEGEGESTCGWQLFSGGGGDVIPCFSLPMAGGWTGVPESQGKAMPCKA